MALFFVGIGLLAVAPGYFVYRLIHLPGELEVQLQTALGANQQRLTILEIMDTQAYKEREAALSRTTQGFFLCFLPLAGFCFLYGRRLRSQSGAEALAADPRAPVVYFRSFQDDEAPELGRKAKNAPYSPIARTQEEHIVKHLGKLGPVIAIGNPNERIPVAGAARFYSTNEEWQSLAHDILSRATLVVYRQGTTPGLLWEIERVRHHIPPDRILLITPDEKTYDAFRDLLASIFSLPLKKDRPMLIGFDAAWNPIVYGRSGWNGTFGGWDPSYLYRSLKKFVRKKLHH